MTDSLLESVLQKKLLPYDKSGEEHFNLISALHKSVRNSDPDASLYWLARMIESGEDPLYLARRMVRMASEDIGLADPNALRVTLAAKDAFEFIGPPEGYLALGEAAVYLALAPKVECPIHGVRRGAAGPQAHDRGTCPVAPTQRGDRFNASYRLWRGLPIRARHRGESHRHAVSSRQLGRTHSTTIRRARASRPKFRNDWRSCGEYKRNRTFQFNPIAMTIAIKPAEAMPLLTQRAASGAARRTSNRDF